MFTSRHKSISLQIICLAAILSLAASCTRETDDDKRHRDVVTATINGKHWEAGCKETPPFGCSIADLQYYPETGSFSLRASNKDESIGIVIWLFDVFSEGSYRINQDLTCGGFKRDTSSCGHWSLFINETDPQEIVINKIDFNEKIIWGSFFFTGNDTSHCNNDPIIIANGYFKVKYRP